MEVSGSVALVSGGASGLGEATVRRFVADGAKVLIMDRNDERGQALATELGEAVRFAQADVTDEASVAAAVAKASELGALKIAVNCAGIGWAMRTLGRDGSPHDLGAFRMVLDINVIGTFNVLRFAASAMAKNEPTADGERGVIINTASIAAFDGQIGQLAYATSKAAIAGLTLPAARDLSAVGISVVTIAPGLFDTPLLALLPEPARQALAANIPFPRRLGIPAEFANLAQTIVRTTYINGETIRLDGSLRMAPK